MAFSYSSTFGIEDGNSLWSFFYLFFWKEKVHDGFGVIHKWRHANLDYFWHPSPHRHAFHYYGFSTVFTKSLTPLPPKAVTPFMDEPLVKTLKREILGWNWVEDKEE